MMRSSPLLLLLILAVVVAETARGDDQSDARQHLESLGLVSMRRAWITPAELRLREQLEVVARLERPFYIARDKYQNLLQAYDAYQARLQQLKELRAQNAARLKQTPLANPAQRQQLESENRKIDESLSQVDKKVRDEYNTADEHSPLVRAAIDSINARMTLALALLKVRASYNQMQEEYTRLGQDSQVAAALEVLEMSDSLGPLENYSVQLSRRLDRLVEAAFSHRMPVYMRSSQWRVSFILNEATPFTFSYVEEEAPTVIPASLVQLAGLEVSESGKRMNLTYGDRIVVGREVILPQLRLGRHVLNDVPAWVLPPEAEDLGARISRQALEKLEPTLDRKRLELTVVP